MQRNNRVISTHTVEDFYKCDHVYVVVEFDGVDVTEQCTFCEELRTIEI
jgi:hypothetical protein